MRRRRREDSEGVREDEDEAVERSGGVGRRSRGRVESTQTRDTFRIRWSLPSWSARSLLVAVVLVMMIGGVEGLRCQCSQSTKAAHCSQQLCDIKEREGKVPACVFVRDGPLQHYACIRVEEDDEMGCRVMRGKAGGHKVACMCRDADMCNVDLADRVDDGGEDRRLLKVPAELIGEPSVVRVRAQQTREGRDHDVLLEPDRDDSLGVAPSVVDFFDEENEIGVGRGGKGGGLNQRERESWSDEEEKRFPSSAYRLVHGVDNGQLVPLTVKRLGEEKRSKLEDNVIDLTKPGYRRPAPVPSPARPPLYPPEIRLPDWRQSGTQPVPRGPFDPVRREEERRRQEEEQRVHRVEWPTRSRPAPPPTTTITPPAPPPPPSRPPTPFTIGRVNSFVERPSPDPIPYPKQRWDDRPNPPPSTSTTASTTTTTPITTTTPRKTYYVSVSRYVVTTSTTTVPPSTTESITTTTASTTTTATTTMEPTTTTTLPPTTTTSPPTTTTTETPTTTVRSTVAPSTTTVDYDDMDGGKEEEEEEYDDVALAADTKANSVPRVAEKEPDSGTINTIWTTVVVTVVFIGVTW